MIRYITLLILGITLTADAQQLPQFSQYFMNDFAINPAMAGIRDRIEVRSNNRYQWEGITDAPRTYTMTLNMPFADESIGFGTYLFTDIVGPTRRIGFQIGGAYRLPLSDEISLGVGLSVGMLEYSVDGHKIDLAQPLDGALLNTLGRSRVIDAKAGLQVSSEDWYVGISIPQVAQNNVDLFAENTAGSSSLQTHYFITGGYRYELNGDYTIEPNVMLKYVSPTPLKMDFSLRGIYKDFLWLGASYRTDDAVAAMIGLEISDKIVFGYSHDFTTSEIRDYSTGTHELMLGLNIAKL